jgi:hypothetical protein
MADDDEQRAAYERAIDYHRFADIVQHYDDTARPDHDDIDYEPASLEQLDGAEFDHNGDDVPCIGIILHINNYIIAIADAIDEFGSFEAIPDNHDFGPNDEPDLSAIFDIDCGHSPTKHRLDGCYGHDDDDPDDPPVAA